ncbi:MAG TPA: group I intron-associated PD-(D/E)XK endonuclease [Solirubrobacteraceae bacterium]
MDGLTPSQKGAAAEAAIAAAVLELGLTVLRPLCEGRRYDLVVDLEPDLLRVQCKLAKHLGDVLGVRLSTSRFTPSGYVTSSYSETEIDAVAVYCPQLRRCFLIPIAEASGMRELYLRLNTTKNKQAQRVRWARDYDLALVLSRMRTTGERFPVATLADPDSGL